MVVFDPAEKPLTLPELPVAVQENQATATLEERAIFVAVPEQTCDVSWVVVRIGFGLTNS